MKLIPLLIAALLIYLAIRQYQSLPRSARKGFLIKIAVYATIAILLLAFFTGRIHWLGAVVAGVLGLLKFGASHFLRFLPFLRFLQSKNVFNNPVFRTPNLELRLDMSTGQMSGKILTGDFAGQAIESLSSEQLDAFEKSVIDSDKRAYYLVKVFRQRMRNDGSANESNTYSKDQSIIAEPNIDEARLILGLPEQYTKKDIDLAYKRLMQKIHPDRGGNDYLASRVNLARDLLIKDLDARS